MKRYLRIYLILLRLNFESLVIYPVNFINSLIAGTAWGFFSLYSIVILTAQTKSVFGWTRDELLLLNGVYSIVIGIFHMVFSRNFERFSGVIHQGQLDGILMKPVDSQFLLSFWLIGWTTMSRIIMAVAYIFLLVHIPLQLTLIHLILFIIFGMLGIFLLYSLWYIIITFTIWFTRLSNLVELMFQITGISRYPREMLVGSAGFAIWFLFPLVLIINIPTKVFLNKLQISEVALLIFLSIGLFFISRKFWKFALQYYTSASS